MGKYIVFIYNTLTDSNKSQEWLNERREKWERIKAAGLGKIYYHYPKWGSYRHAIDRRCFVEFETELEAIEFKLKYL